MRSASPATAPRLRTTPPTPADDRQTEDRSPEHAVSIVDEDPLRVDCQGAPSSPPSTASSDPPTASDRRSLTGGGTIPKFLRRPVGCGHTRSSSETTEMPVRMLYAILCYHDEDVVGSWTKEQDDAVMAKLAVVQDKLRQAGPARPGRAAAADHGGDHAAQGRSAAGARRPVRRDQGAAARLLRRRLRESRRGARRRARSRRGQSRRRLRDPPGRHVHAGERARRDRHRLDRCAR